ncbi:DNA alkylation repair protein [Alkalihalobacterium bogoriense]|uniref:DNA alkylation repair protein n=1 Tax=Alkalihalobacterium bogoriense TaxID=246272 RepID=UPI00047AE582|nr:DNA alkylation repair protein [Alkalihalobacterium bogoriense]
MAEPLKNMYNDAFFSQFFQKVKAVYPEFQERRFLHFLFDENWETKELKERIRHITHSIAYTFPDSYEDSLRILLTLHETCKGFEYLFFPDFVEVYGQNDWDLSLHALTIFTSGSTSEYAVRPFIEKDPEKMVATMITWADNPNEHIRRLASEGSRPRLPWAKPLHEFKRDPTPILPLLIKLKQDESQYVRKSVANHLNDISKDNPNIVINLCKLWKGTNPYTDWIIKHGCRTLLRQAHPDILQLFGFSKNPTVIVDQLTISGNSIYIGESFTFQFRLTNPLEEAALLRVEYAIDFVKANGKHSRKLFKITENKYKHGTVQFTRRHSFKNLSTRIHYAGTHHLSIIVNGNELDSISFELTNKEKQTQP